MHDVKVYLWGMDSWSGRELISTKFFTDIFLATEYIDSINSKNTLDTAPEYYTYAELA